MALSKKKGEVAAFAFRREMFEIPTPGKLQLLSAPGFGLDDLRIYSIVLSPERIRELCQDLKPGQPGPDPMSSPGESESKNEE
jgi:hypothetical protein